jgi:hypothetical protein
VLKVTSASAFLEDQKRSEYPRLKISTNLGQIVLFSAPCTGTILDPGNSASVKGEYCTHWLEEWFIDFFGSVTLSETKN